jgi:hypothetical protein
MNSILPEAMATLARIEAEYGIGEHAPKAAPRMASGIEGVYVHGQHVTARDRARAYRKLTLAIEDNDAALSMADQAKGEGDSTAAIAAVDMALLAGSYRASARRMLGLGAVSTASAFYAAAIG